MTPAEKSIKYMRMLCQKYSLTEPVIQYVSRQVCSAGKRNGKPIYNVSVDRLQDETVYGFLEYKRLQHFWSHLKLDEFIVYPYPNQPQKGRYASNVKGDLAIHCVTLHEFAHIAHIMNKLIDSTPHGPEYQVWLKRIIRENPYRENFWAPIVESWERFL